MEHTEKATTHDHPDREVKPIPADLESHHAVGEYPISVGTSLAIERLIEPALHNALYININTLIRNALSSMPSEIQAGINPSPLAVWTLRDMQLIQSIFDQEKIPVRFYSLTQKSLSKKYSVGTLRVPKTVKQMATKDLFETVANAVVKQIKDDQKHGMKDISLLTGDMSVFVEYDRPLFMTSTPIDIVEMGKGSKFGLLQSYTGKIVGAFDMFNFFQVNSKHKERSYQRIPFNKLFIQIFGDGKTFHQSGVVLLNTILDCADRNEWTQASTAERIRLTMTIDDIWDESYSKAFF